MFAVEFTAFVVVLGIPDGALGVLWPGMRGTFHRAIGDLGYVAIAGTVLYLFGGIAYAWLAGRASNGLLIFASCAASAVSAAVWAAAGTWALLLIGFGLFGIGRGALDAAVNADAAHQIKRLGWLHAGWSVGGALGPLLVAGLAGVASWRLPVALIAVATACVSVVAAYTARLSTYDGAPTTHHERPATLPHLRAAVVLIAFATYTAAEIGPIAWGYVYLTDHRGLSNGAAAAAVAVFWIALTAGRVALGAFGQHADARRILVASGVGLVAALALFWAGAATGLAFVAMALGGLASAAVFPVLVNVTPAIVGSAAAERTIGLAIAAAAIGGPAAVLIEGLLANAHGVQVLAPAMFVAALMLAVAIALLVRVLAGREHAAP